MLQSYAAVYCGNQNCSYHGTTVQLVQPDATITYPSISSLQTIDDTATDHLNNNTTELQSSSQRHRRSTSPGSSPHKLGKTGPKRMRTITKRDLTKQTPNITANNNDNEIIPSLPLPSTLTLENFLENPEEKLEGEALCLKMLLYTFQKFSISQQSINKHETILKDIRHFLNDKPCQHPKMSTIHYMELVNENPDSDETMTLISEDIIDKLGSTVQDGWIVIVGDGKTYQHLCNIKQMYTGTFQKLLISPGDWHILKNFQPVLMKLYYNAGLKELAQASGFQGATLKSLETCGNFKRTHYFLLQAWEALYREMWNVYLTDNKLKSLIDSASCIISASIENTQTSSHLMQQIKGLLDDSSIQKSLEEYVMKKEDQTWKLWAQFLFRDCFSYIGLYLAIRGSNWKLRISCLKLMSPLFAVLDRSTYERIIPNHLADIQRYPSNILQCLASGGFTVNVAGHSWHAVALDEAHEMCINKDLKAAVVYPTQAYLQKTTLFLNNRIKAYKNLIQQLFPGKAKADFDENDITDSTPNAKHQEENIEQMCTLIYSNKLFDLQQPNRGIVNVFSGTKATEEQASDMLNCHEIGTESFHNYINYHILKKPSSTNAPVRKHKLLTMASLKPKRQRATPQQKEAKQVIQCLRRRPAWSKHNEQQPDALNNDQYSILPRAIVDEEGYPHKGNKSRWTNKLETRYKSALPSVFTNFPPWTPQVTIIDAMFLINIRPLRRTKTITEYTSLLFHQAVVQYYKAGTDEVHLIFDKPERQSLTQS